MRQNGRKWLSNNATAATKCGAMSNKTKSEPNSYQTPQARRGGEWTTGMTKVLIYDASGILERALVQVLARPEATTRNESSENAS